MVKQRGRWVFQYGIDGNYLFYATDGVLGNYSHIAGLSKPTVGAYTIPVPARDGLVLEIISRSAAAHVATGTGLLDDGTGAASKNTLTFAAFPGASAILRSLGGKWNVLLKNGVTVG